MSNAPADDAMAELGRVVANHLVFDGTGKELRRLADRLLTDDRAALRLGRAIGFAVDRYCARAGSHD